MFVSIQRVNTPSNSTSIYECDQVRIKPDPDDPEDHVLVSMEGIRSRDHMHIKCDKATTEVYLMNSDGKTIDSYRWRR